MALVAAVLSARRYDARTVKLVLSRLHTRFKLLFQELALHQMSEWNAEHIFPSYLKGEVLEVERLKQLIHHCETELLEMDAIEHYREDETHAPIVIIE